MNKHIIVQGKVQCVSFRYYTEREAKSIGITGTVRNLPNGAVEIYASGTEVQLKKLEKWCWIGSPYSTVKSVTSQDSPTKDEFIDFKIIY